jgi:hypothetical protein
MPGKPIAIFKWGFNGFLRVFKNQQNPKNEKT